MALLSLGEENPTKLPKNLTARLDRGRERLSMIATERDVAWEFYRGNHNAYTDEKNKIAFEPTVTTVRGQGKPRWKSAQKRNLIFDAVLYESSAATQRVPGYQVVPSTEDPEDRSAAQLAEKVALYGHGKWNLRKAASDAVIHAIVGGEAFAWPFFDNTIGPYIGSEEGEFVGQGDVQVRVFGSNECYWEPGLRFEDSPWHAVEQARTPESVEQMQGYMLKPGTLTADADTRQLSNQGRTHQGNRKLVVVTDYLERPSPANPDGNWVTLANGKRIVPDRPYPCEGTDPVLQKLSYAPDPDSDRDFGLVPQLLDAQRTHNAANNRIVEWSALCLLPRIVVTPGLMKKQRWTSEPGKVYEVPQPDQNFKVVDTPTVPRELFELTERAEHDIGRLSAQNDIPTQVESGRGIQALLEKDQARRAAFTAHLADWYGRLMHDCLYLVQKHYTEDRTLKIKGGFGWESIADFQGANLRDQIDVRVFPDSIEPRTRQAVEQRMMNYAQLGWVGPDQAMSAIESGTAEALMSSLMRDEARAHRIIQRVKQGPDALAAMPMIPTGRTAKVPDPNGQIDEMTGEPLMIDTGKPEMAPAWMPRYADNLKVFRDVIEDWIATEEFENLAPELQEAAAEIYMGVIELEAAKAQEQAMAQQAQAEQYGMDNAASGGKPKPNPSFPALDQQEQAQT